MRPRSCLKIVLALALVIGVALPGCSTLPSLDGRSNSTALRDTGSTPLGKAAAALTASHADDSGVYPLASGRDAFAARVLLANAAERSLDVQYYIWRNDITGVLLFKALRAAAERGVRVRLLLDDNNTGSLDTILAVLNAHPNIEVRLFNPFVLRSSRVLGYLTDFSRLNRRMHNKSFTADNQATIVGGRNIGDNYFGAAGEVLFADLDVIAIGPVVDAVSRDFDRYWNSQSAYPLGLLVPVQKQGTAAELGKEEARIEGTPAARAYRQALRELTFVTQLMQRSLPLEWGPTRLVSDDPAKVLGLAAPESRVSVKLRQLLGEPVTELTLVSPYFVPGRDAAETLAGMARRGVKVQILTNSLEATDVTPVHAGYAKWRKPLIEAGVSLFELRRGWTLDDAEYRRTGPLGSSGASLHAKTFSADRRRVFVGSFNFDPRSNALNTEMGLVIDSPALAQQMATVLEQRIPTRAYEVRLAPDGSLYWIERGVGPEIRHDSEPGSSFWQRIEVGVLSVLPIEWLL